MGEQLRAFFTRARDQGGIALAGKLALKTRLNSASAAAQPDVPQAVAMVKQALEECLRETASAAAASSAPRAPAAAGGGRIKQLFDFARQQGGVPLLVKLAAKTGVTSHAAESAPDDPAKLARLRSALQELMPGIEVPAA